MRETGDGALVPVSEEVTEKPRERKWWKEVEA